VATSASLFTCANSAVYNMHFPYNSGSVLFVNKGIKVSSFFLLYRY